MNLHEYQGKEILASYGVKIQKGLVATTLEEAEAAYAKVVADSGNDVVVVKAQIHAGGRGKGGGVKLAKNAAELKEHAGNILGMMLKTPTEGGMNIEEVAEKTPHLVHSEHIDPTLGMLPFQGRKIAFNLGLSGAAFKDMVKFINNLYKAFVGSDASLFEINPCLKSANDEIIAVDTKVSLDENALFRHPDLEALRDTSEEDPTEVEAKEVGLNYVNLDGNVGCMVNGAGLAMATMDIIKLSGGSPANFLDVGGTADAARVEHAFRIILRDPEVKAILINIFGGIVRCDRVAQGVVDAYKNMGNISVPIIVRLQGTNAEIAKKLIDESGLEVKSAILLQEAADIVKEVLA